MHTIDLRTGVVPTSEFRTHFAAYQKRAADGETIVVTVNGTPSVVLISIDAWHGVSKLPATVAQFLALAAQVKQIAESGASWETKCGLLLSDDYSVKLRGLGLDDDGLVRSLGYETNVRNFSAAVKAKADEYRAAFGWRS